ncbi:MAG TPA: cupin domain-containing protein [Woeseiaceae bacterium]|nr:cupin domain-containing protein [Woeseiaceae bacterium]
MTPARALQAARASDDGLYGVMLENGTMELGFYCPRVVDEQQAHTQDELYIVQAGSGVFYCGNEKIDFAPGDALFVAAGVEHRFADFGDDFSAWVIFYGPDGGEL